MMTDFYKREMQTTIGKFAILVLGQYLNRNEPGMERLDEKQVVSINQSLDMWFRQCSMASEQVFAKHVCFSFNIPCSSYKCYVSMKFKQRKTEFSTWLAQFIEANGIEFPHAETFFQMMILCFLKDEDKEKIDLNSDLMDSIKKVRENICNMMVNNNMMEEDNASSNDMSNVLGDDEESITKPLKMAPLLDFEGEIWFEEMKTDQMNATDDIIIQELK
eukprot:TRINITY_DN396_c0_g1_i8.p1 TRINITY_DN396_c0_g1~~TRINITY_DN396_c0_g1_i8.p1  ORF type:complete len:218 (-),score=68.04 TRINITY_DN396_c0_g1_i8:281-934(-)